MLKVHGDSGSEDRPGSRHVLAARSPGQLAASVTVATNSLIHDAIQKMSSGGQRLLLVTDSANRWVDFLTDADLRAYAMADLSLDQAVQAVLDHRQTPPPLDPHLTDSSAQGEALRDLMNRRHVDFLVQANGNREVIGLVTRDQWESPSLGDRGNGVEALIMAGGFGKRLRPLTVDVPKPMLPVGDRPVMEWIIGRLVQTGIRTVHVATHFMPEKIMDHFGDGRRFGVQIRYVNEDRPLGTAGALSLVKTDKPLLVMNGDILSEIDFHALVDYHHRSSAQMTVGVRKFDYQVPYGVVESTGGLIRQIVEKPVLAFFVNAGIYLLEPEVRARIPLGTRQDMPDLIRGLIADHGSVASFPILEYWLDIGKPVDYEQAQRDARQGRFAA
ncbi:MAG: nucleotidyltransferase family protein [Planctomycetota bacterium]